MLSTYLLLACLAALGLATNMEMKRQILSSCSRPNEPFCCARTKVTVYAGEDDGEGREVYDDECMYARRIVCSVQ
jgi:hypothetical protein